MSGYFVSYYAVYTGKCGLSGVRNGEVHSLADLHARNAEVEPLLEDNVLELRVGLCVMHYVHS